MADPIARRISGLLAALAELFANRLEKDWLTRQMKIILDAIREEIEEDSTIFSGTPGQIWLQDFAKLMDWTATGDYSALPEHLVPIAYQIDGKPLPEKSEPLFEYTAQNTELTGTVAIPRVPDGAH